MSHLNYYVKRESICYNSKYMCRTLFIFIFSSKSLVYFCVIFFSQTEILLKSVLFMVRIMFLLILGDAVSECATSYYSEYDPFDYLYSSCTQYSDPLYEAVIKTSITSNERCDSITPSQSFDLSQISEKLERTSFTAPDWDEEDNELCDFTMISTLTVAPPLPPRNVTRQSSFSESNRPNLIRTNKSGVDRLKIATKLYENVIENRTYDAELLAFYNMVSWNCAMKRQKTKQKFFFFYKI